LQRSVYLLSSTMKHWAVRWTFTEVSEEHAASIFKDEY
jgi:hypothetical protein